jgi:hypothetical protein
MIGHLRSRVPRAALQTARLRLELALLLPMEAAGALNLAVGQLKEERPCWSGIPVHRRPSVPSWPKYPPRPIRRIPAVSPGLGAHPLEIDDDGIVQVTGE